MKISPLTKILYLLLILLFLMSSCEKKKQITVKNIDNTAEIKRLTTIADADFDKNEYQKAYKNYLIIEQLSDPEKNRIDYVDALISIALIQQFDGNYLKSEITATKILPHLKYLKKPRFAWETYKIFTNNYLATKDYENALIYAKKAYDLNASPRREANALANIALVYMHLEEHKKAIKIYTKVTTSGYYGEKKKANTLKNYELIDYGIMISNIGISYFQLHDPRSIDYYKQALKIRIATNDRQQLPDSYSNLSDYYLHKNPRLAKRYAETAYKLACEVNVYSAKKYAMLCLILTSNGNDLKKYTNLYIKFNDSMTKSRLIEKNQFANMKYNFKKDIEENLHLKTQKVENELQLERQKNRSYISFSAIFMSLFILLFLVFYLNLNGKREKNDAIFKSEMRISNKLHHELSEDVHQILLFADSSNLNNNEKKEELLQYLSDIYTKTRNISKENSKVPTDTRYISVLKEMISEYKTPDSNIILNGFDLIPWDLVEKNKKIILYRILQELLFNMRKYNNSTMASIVLKLNNKKLSILYAENTNEFRSNQNILQKRLQNVENRIKTIKGTINFDTTLEKAFKINFTFPI